MRQAFSENGITRLGFCSEDASDRSGPTPGVAAPRYQRFERLPILELHESDCKACLQLTNDAANDSSDRERRADPRPDIGCHRGARGR